MTTPVVNSFNDWDPLEEIIVGAPYHLDYSNDVSFRLFFHDNLHPEPSLDIRGPMRVFGGEPSNALRDEMLEDLVGVIQMFEKAGVVVRRPTVMHEAPTIRTTTGTMKSTSRTITSTAHSSRCDPGALLMHERIDVAKLPSFLRGWEILRYQPLPDDEDSQGLPFLASEAIGMNVLSLDPERVVVQDRQVPLMRTGTGRLHACPVPMAARPIRRGRVPLHDARYQATWTARGLPDVRTGRRSRKARTRHYRLIGGRGAMSRLPLRVGVIGCGVVARVMHLPTIAKYPDLFVEKPLCYTRVAADRLTALAASGWPVAMVGYMKWFDPAYRAAVEPVRERRDWRWAQVLSVLTPESAYLDHLGVGGEQAARLERAYLSDPVLRDELATDSPDALTSHVELLLDSAIHELYVLRGLLGDPVALKDAALWAGDTALRASWRFDGDVPGSVTFLAFEQPGTYVEDAYCVGPTRRVRLSFPSPYLRHAPTGLEVEEVVDGTPAGQAPSRLRRGVRAGAAPLRRVRGGGARAEVTTAGGAKDVALIQGVSRAARGLAVPVAATPPA